MIPCNKSSDGFVEHTLIGSSVLSLIGLLGNLLVIVIVYRAKRKKSMSTYLLLSLAIADIVNLLGVDVVAVMVFLLKQHRGEKTTLLILTVPPKIVANFTLAVIALERYDALVRTVTSFMRLTKKKILIGESTMWFIGLVLSTSMFTEMILHHEKCRPPDWHFHVLSTFLLFLGYIVLIVMVLFCYSSIVISLYFNCTILGKKVTDEASLNENKRLIRTLIIITLVFLVTNLPTIIILMLKQYHFYGGEKKGLYLAVMIVGCTSSSVNPFIYILVSKKYRNQIKELFCRKEENYAGQPSPVVIDTKL